MLGNKRRTHTKLCRLVFELDDFRAARHHEDPESQCWQASLLCRRSSGPCSSVSIITQLAQIIRDEWKHPHTSLQFLRDEDRHKDKTCTVKRWPRLKDTGRGTVTLPTLTGAITCCHALDGAPQSSTLEEWRTRDVHGAGARPTSGHCWRRAGWEHSGEWVHCSPTAEVAGAQRCWPGTTAALTVCSGLPQSPAVGQIDGRYRIHVHY